MIYESTRISRELKKKNKITRNAFAKKDILKERHVNREEE